MDKAFVSTHAEIKFHELSYDEIPSHIPKRFEGNIKDVIIKSEVEYPPYDESPDCICILQILLHNPVEIVSEKYIMDVLKKKTKDQMLKICSVLDIPVGSGWSKEYLIDLVISRRIHFDLKTFEDGIRFP